MSSPDEPLIAEAGGDRDAGRRQSGGLRRRVSGVPDAPALADGVRPGDDGVSRRRRRRPRPQRRLGRRGAWAGPPPQWWAQQFGIEPDLAEALVCAAARETFEESGVLFAGPVDDPDGIVGDASVYGDSRRALAEGSLSFADFLRRENLVLRSDLLRPWANWVTPEAERTRRYDTYFFVGALPEGQRADGENTESDHAGWTTPQAAIDDFEAGRNFLLPPTWTQLDSLAGRTVADVLAVERQIVTVQPHLEIQGDNWIFEFFDSDRYHRARKSGGMGWRH